MRASQVEAAVSGGRAYTSGILQEFTDGRARRLALSDPAEQACVATSGRYGARRNIERHFARNQ